MDVRAQLDVYEKACLAYARQAREMRPGECDRQAMVGAFLTIKAAFEPQITHVIYNEGEVWIPHEPGKRRQGPIHAFKCEDGRIWDVHNGWRT